MPPCSKSAHSPTLKACMIRLCAWRFSKQIPSQVTWVTMSVRCLSQQILCPKCTRGLEKENSKLSLCQRQRLMFKLEVYSTLVRRSWSNQTCNLCTRKWRPFKMIGYRLIESWSCLDFISSTIGVEKRHEMLLEHKEVLLWEAKIFSLVLQGRGLSSLLSIKSRRRSP